MTTTARTFTNADLGCYLDNHRGHYIVRDMVELAIEFGFIVDELERFALDMYGSHGHEESFPYEALQDLADEALEWLNAGSNEGLDRPIKGQNSPPVIPGGTAWAWFDGDFGLYAIGDLDA